MWDVYFNYDCLGGSGGHRAEVTGENCGSCARSRGENDAGWQGVFDGYVAGVGWAGVMDVDGVGEAGAGCDRVGSGGLRDGQVGFEDEGCDDGGGVVGWG